MLSIRPGKIRIEQFNMTSKREKASLEDIMNNRRCRIKEKRISNNMYGETTVYLEYYDMNGKQND